MRFEGTGPEDGDGKDPKVQSRGVRVVLKVLEGSLNRVVRNKRNSCSPARTKCDDASCARAARLVAWQAGLSPGRR